MFYLREDAHFLIRKQFDSFVLQDDICCGLQPIFIFRCNLRQHWRLPAIEPIQTYFQKTGKLEFVSGSCAKSTDKFTVKHTSTNKSRKIDRKVVGDWSGWPWSVFWASGNEISMLKWVEAFTFAFDQGQVDWPPSSPPLTPLTVSLTAKETVFMGSEVGS